MRTTVRLDEELMRDAKRAAAESGKTLTALIEDALREVLARRKAPRSRKPVEIPTFGGDGLQPGVDISSYAALVDLMEEADASARR